MPTLTTRKNTDLALAELTASAKSFMAEAKSPATKRAYRSDWASFTAFCSDRNLIPMPAHPETIALYAAYCADSGLSVATLGRRLASVSEAHRVAGYESPVSSPIVRTTVAGIRRRLGVAQQGKAPILLADLRRMLAEIPDTTKGTRDRALFLMGFASGMRRSEIVALNHDDVQASENGLIVTIRRSKTDQEGAGRKIGIPWGSNPATCPVRAMKAWVADSGYTTGPVFRAVNQVGEVSKTRLGDRVVGDVVKFYAKKVGLDPMTFGGHSLRSGMITEASANGATEYSIMQQSGHKSLTIMRRYRREASLFKENAAAVLGL